METVVGIVAAAAPFGAVLGLMVWSGWRERRRQDVVARQIALTDAIHERLGAVAAPFVRRVRGGWQVRMAVPFERPAVVDALLAVVAESVAPVEIVLTRQLTPPGGGPATPTRGRSVGQEFASWT